MMIPKSIPFNFMNLKVSYEYDESIFHISAILPHSILKLSTYQKSTKTKFEK